MPATPSLETSEVLETRSVQLEWKVTNLRTLFDATKGDAKSKCIKSPLFDQSRWQIFLYPNSGHEQYVSLYLSCEPTEAEKERALSEKPDLTTTTPGVGSSDVRLGKDSGKEKDRMPWKRDGHFKFTFEARSVDRRVTFKQLEADEHHFTHKTRNWGYQSFWKRSEAFYNNPSTRSSDAFLIICTIVSAPSLPTSPPLPHLLVPKTLISAYASMFDDPDYSDVVFRIQPEQDTTAAHGRPQKKKREKRLYAAKKVLAGRSEYFDDMFSSGFNESTFSIAARASTSRRATPAHAMRELEDEGEPEYGLESSEEGEDDDSDFGWDEDDDSGEEEDEGEEVASSSEEAERDVVDTVVGTPRTASIPYTAKDASPVPSPSLDTSTQRSRSLLDAPTRSRTSSAALSDDERLADLPPPSTPPMQRQDSVRTERAEDPSDTEADNQDTGATDAASLRSRYVDASSVPPSPVKPTSRRAPTTAATGAVKKRPRTRPVDDRPRFEVVVADAAYSTFRGLLHYLYTDSIQFAPLASTYYAARDHAAATEQPFPWPSRRAFLLAHSPQHLTGATTGIGGAQTAGPCSAKAIYRLADKMGLAELKERAYEHIVQSLTPQNIVYEVFGSFSTRFDEVRRVEVAYLLDKWNEVRSSAQMRTVFDYLRTSRFPGFEEVWFEIVQNLEVKIPPALASGSNLATSAGGGVRGSEGGGGGPGFGGAGTGLRDSLGGGGDA
ncbi:hypothetical protein JCM10908_005789 [Rhodotorula pacifica]|uniref:BTB/POZ and MATH domain-containing protein n=1 Tax=Rhodotorula pacifica TaxID=1495444 RepID=UPI00316E6AF2